MCGGVRSLQTFAAPREGATSLRGEASLREATQVLGQIAHGARFVPEAKAAGGAAVERSLGEGLRRSFGQDPVKP